jgi:hypothetical protein
MKITTMNGEYMFSTSMPIYTEVDGVPGVALEAVNVENANVRVQVFLPSWDVNSILDATMGHEVCGICGQDLYVFRGGHGTREVGEICNECWDKSNHPAVGRLRELSKILERAVEDAEHPDPDSEGKP